jgi:cystathionine beta-lyase family protein involved in aluminum resistance
MILKKTTSNKNNIIKGQRQTPFPKKPAITIAGIDRMILLIQRKDNKLN